MDMKRMKLSTKLDKYIQTNSNEMRTFNQMAFSGDLQLEPEEEIRLREEFRRRAEELQAVRWKFLSREMGRKDMENFLKSWVPRLRTGFFFTPNLSMSDWKYYPTYDDPDFYSKLYHKKEFYKYRKIRDEIQQRSFEKEEGRIQLQTHQQIVANYANPNTPYRNLMIFHGVGVGKTLSSIAVAESFRENIEAMNDQGYRSRVYILAFHEAKNNFVNELLLNFGYLTNEERLSYMELKRLAFTSPEMEKRFLADRNRYMKRLRTDGKYRFYGYGSFQNETIGREIESHEEGAQKIEGKWFKLSNLDKQLKNINDSILIIDEAHRLEGNNWGIAVRHILKNSKNVRVILLTATPMLHHPREIVEILNFIIPTPLSVNDVFSGPKLRPDGIKKIKQASKGFVSYVRGINPLTFPRRIDEGEIPSKLSIPSWVASKWGSFKFTPIVRCIMKGLQLKTYEKLTDPETLIIPKETHGYFLDFSFPEWEGGDLRKAPKSWLEKHDMELTRDVWSDDPKAVELTGDFLKREKVGEYSAKAEKMLDILDKGKGLFFIYAEAVETAGIKQIRQCLLRNGYADYKAGVQSDSPGLDLVRCYSCGVIRKKHGKDHEYMPATFATIFGAIPLQRRKEMIDVVNRNNNKDGRLVKIVLGSEVTRESVDFKRMENVIIFSHQDNFSSNEQVIGRAARHLSHEGLPEGRKAVHIYRLVASLKSGKISSEEYQYLKQEKIHMTIKKIERALKEAAFDCALNKAENVQEVEVANKITGSICDYQDCYYTCDWEPPIDKEKSRGHLVPFFKALEMDELDTSTYEMDFYRSEVNMAKRIIRHLFATENICWTINGLKKRVRDVASESETGRIMEDKYIFVAIDELVSTAQATIRDMHGTEGFIRYKGGFYIFQPKGGKEDMSLEERFTPLKATEPISASIGTFLEQEARALEKMSFDFAKFKSKILRRAKKPIRISRIISRLDINLQIQILEDVIQDWMEKKGDKLFNSLILNHYKSYLVTASQLKSIEKRDYTDTTSSEGVDFRFPEKSRDFIGHVLDIYPKCYANGQWRNCRIDDRDINEMLNMKENPVIIGIMDRNKRREIIFKLKYPSSGVDADEIPHMDRRKIQRGFVCSQVNDKNEILKIGRNLGLEMDEKLPIHSICQRLEDDLRKKQTEAIKKGEMVRWFYDTIDVQKRRSRGEEI